MIAQAHVDTDAGFLQTTGLTQYYDRAKAPVQLLDAGTDPSSGHYCVRAVYAAIDPENVCMICTRGTVSAQCVARSASNILGSHVVGREDTAIHPRSCKYDTIFILQIHSNDGRSNASLIKALKEQSSREGGMRVNNHNFEVLPSLTRNIFAHAIPRNKTTLSFVPHCVGT